MVVAVLDVNHLSFTYPGAAQPALSDISFRLPDHGVFGLVGMNGSGKSTLLSLVAGLRVPTRGAVVLDRRRPSERDVLKQIMLLSGNEDLPEFLTGEELVRLYAALYGVALDERLLAHFVERYELSGRMGDLLEDLSHGTKKKIQFLCALLVRRRVTIIDETLNGVDFRSIRAAKHDLAELGAHATVILCSHDQFLLDGVVDRFLVVDRGSLLLDAPVEDVLSTFGSATEMLSQLVDRG